ncbi:MAG: hypothetical protein HZB76_03750 [Chlamydiae bacterium]|nr:hypothetical protein [Chlamydiota bacterium]
MAALPLVGTLRPALPPVMPHQAFDVGGSAREPERLPAAGAAAAAAADDNGVDAFDEKILPDQVSGTIENLKVLLTRLSTQGAVWPQVIKDEWELERLEETDSKFKRCLCDNSIIRRCYLKNKKNGNRAVLGDRCLTLLANEAGVEEFRNVGKIFRSFKRVCGHPDDSVSPEYADYLEKRKIWGPREAGFYKSNRLKDKLSDRQKPFKAKLNKIARFALAGAQKGVNVVSDSVGVSANPALIQEAFDQKVINSNALRFYMDVWQKEDGVLSEKQRHYKLILNDNILKAWAAKKLRV